MRTINSGEFAKILEETYLHLKSLTNTKGREYGGPEGADNRHSNFDRLSTKLNIHPMKILQVFLTKHLDAIDTYVREIDAPARETYSEPIEGRIDDALLYLVLLKAMVERYRELPPLAEEPEKRYTESVPSFPGYTAPIPIAPVQPENAETVHVTLKNSPAYHIGAHPSVLDNRPSWQRGK